MRTAAAMTREVIVVFPELELSIAANVMKQHQIRHLPVVQAGRLVGILSDRDLLSREPIPAGLLCGEAMTPAPVTCTSATPVGQVAGLMIEHKIDCVPVVDEGGKLIGLVTSTDLLALLVEHEGVRRLPFDFRLRRFDEAAIA